MCNFFEWFFNIIIPVDIVFRRFVWEHFENVAICFLFIIKYYCYFYPTTLLSKKKCLLNIVMFALPSFLAENLTYFQSNVFWNTYLSFQNLHYLYSYSMLNFFDRHITYYLRRCITIFMVPKLKTCDARTLSNDH